MYVCTSLWGAKTLKIRKKGCVFGDGHKLKKNDGEKLRKNMQKRLFRVYFHAWKIHAWGVF